MNVIEKANEEQYTGATAVEGTEDTEKCRQKNPDHDRQSQRDSGKSTNPGNDMGCRYDCDAVAWNGEKPLLDYGLEGSTASSTEIV